MIISFKDGQFKTSKSGLVQYDFGQYIYVYGIDIDVNYLEFQFIQNGIQTNMLGELQEDGSFKVRIPDEMLQNSTDIVCYVYFETEFEGNTEKQIVLNILNREFYTETPSPETESLIGEILEKLNEIQDWIDNFELSQEQIDLIVQQVLDVINDEYYTKDEIDEKFSEIDTSTYATKAELESAVDDLQDEIDAIDTSNYVTKTEFNNYKNTNDEAVTENTEDIADLEAAMATKANISDIPDTSNLATKQELQTGLNGKVDNSTLNNYYTKTEEDALLLNKADKSTTYTKTEIDTALAGKVDDSDLNNYYTKSQTYNQTEINALINAISTLNIEVVSQLPTQNISTTTIYLIPSQDPQTANAKDEYINLDGTSQGWELIGSTAIDLTNYVTSTQLATVLLDYVTATDLTSTLSSYVTSSNLATILTDYVTNTGLATALNSYYTKTEADNLLLDKADKTTTYTKTETDALLANKANTSTTYTKSEVDTLLNGKASTTALNNLNAETVKNAAIGNVEEIGELATSTYSIGDIFLATDGNLYKATAAITVYDVLTVNTNCVLDTIANEIYNLNTIIGDINTLLAAI